MSAVARRSLYGSAFVLSLSSFATAAPVATYGTVAAQPASNIVASNAHTNFTTASPDPVTGARDTFTNVGTTAQGFGHRGQTFTVGNNPDGTVFDLNSIGIRTDVNTSDQGFAQSFTGGTLTLWIFEWSPNDATNASQWTTGDGMADSLPFDQTGITNFLVNGEQFAINQSFSGEYLRFSTTGVQLNENTAYAYLLAFDVAGANGLRLDQVRDGTAPTGQSYTGGAFLQVSDTANTHNASGDDMVFFVEATAVVPEPTGAALGLGALCLLAARRRRRASSR